MTIKTYEELINKTSKFPQDQALTYLALGINGEAGEIAEKVKKLIRDTDGKETEEFKTALKKECSDVLWYLTALSKHLGSGLEEIMQINHDKLTKRLETNTIHGSGDDREEDIRVKGETIEEWYRH